MVELLQEADHEQVQEMMDDLSQRLLHLPQDSDQRGPGRMDVIELAPFIVLRKELKPSSAYHLQTFLYSTGRLVCLYDICYKCAYIARKRCC